MTNVRELLLPALRWDPKAGYDKERALIEQSLEMGVGGFALFGGEVEQVAKLTSELRERSKIPLLIGSDLERGAGQQFQGATGLPPLAAIGYLDDVDAATRAARISAREARAVGVNWIYAPVADIDVEPENPIIGTRAFGGDVTRVARDVAAWIEGCQAEGVLACAKHFPGHGRTTADSHATLPTVELDAGQLRATDMEPFRSAIKARVASVMSAHISFPALDPSGAPATLSPAILRDILRDELGFDGLVVTDAMIMEGVLGEGEARAAVRALGAGCDLLLYPTNLAAVGDAVQAALDSGALDAKRIDASLQRRAAHARDAWQRKPDLSALGEDRAWAEELAQRVIHEVRGKAPAALTCVELTVVDDDVGGPYPPPSRAPFADELKGWGAAVCEEGNERAAQATAVIALFGDIRSWKGRPGYSAASLQAVRDAVARTRERKQEAVIVQFSHPRLAASIEADVPIVCAWGGEAAMQQAAARWLTRGSK
ncbi:MAG TPA: glycoside hydrolase family 3 N-terminal domain-containing protein [Gemmatimonadaceae bacterium]|nr:glycoside hydrolase family 3 N-terminal domain-containing protein [Gemmatimonadaceae bacterium]